MTTYIAHRTDVVLSAVQPAWLTTGEIDAALYDAGHRWSPQITRDTLHYLASKGKIERRKQGAGYVWRTPEPAAVEPQAQRDPLAVLDELRAAIEAAQRPAPEALPSDELRISDEADLVNLLQIDDQLTTRLIQRAAYEALVGLLVVLNGWIEGARENNEALNRRDDDPEQFHAEDIRRMVNDAARLAGTREPYRPAASE